MNFTVLSSKAYPSGAKICVNVYSPVYPPFGEPLSSTYSYSPSMLICPFSSDVRITPCSSIPSPVNLNCAPRSPTSSFPSSCSAYVVTFKLYFGTSSSSIFISIVGISSVVVIVAVASPFIVCVKPLPVFVTEKVIASFR